MGSTNAAFRAALTRNPFNIVDVYGPDDLPPEILAPDGVLRRPLARATKYIFHTNFVVPRLLIPSALSPVDFVVTEITTSHTSVNLLVDGDDTPHIWGRNIGPFLVRDCQFVDISNGPGVRGDTTLFDLTGGTVVSFLGLVFLTFFNFKRMGDFVDIAYQINGILVQNCGAGFVSRINSGLALSHRVDGLRMQQLPAAAAMDKPMFVLEGSPVTAEVSLGTIDLAAGDDAFLIDSAATGNYVFTGNVYGGPTDGNFYRPDVSQGISAQANADIAITGFSDSAANPGVDTTVSFASQPGLVKGQVILIGGAPAAYNGTHTIVRVADDELSFDITVAFTVGGTGNVKLTRMTTAAAHPIVKDETVTVSATANYNGTYKAVFVTETTVDLPVAFVADEGVGTLASTGRDQTSIGVTARTNGALIDSKSIGSFLVNGNAAATTIGAADTWQAITLTGATEGTNIERWSLTTAANGILTHQDNRPFSGTLVASVSGFKLTDTELYEFGISLNGADPTGPIFPLEVKTEVRNVVPIGAVNVTTGDTVQLMVRAVGHTESLTVDSVSLVVQ